MVHKNRKSKIWFVISAFAILCVAGMFLPAIRAKAALILPSYIIAGYSGETALVGEEIDRDQLVVQASYEDGTVETVTEYYLSTDKILKEGENEIVVVYRGQRASFFVTGKRVEKLNAYYIGEDVSVGNSVSKRNIYVSAVYTDGSVGEVKDFYMGSSVISRVGTNIINLMYGGKSATVEVTGRAAGTVSSLLVTYSGDDVMMGSPIKREDLLVIALYTDGTSEIIDNYQLSMETPDMIGVNTVVVTYRLRTASFLVIGYEKSIEKLTASYTGSGVEIGKEVRKSDIKVTATYADGSVEAVTEFDLPTPVIYYVGAHTKTVHYMGLTADIFVIGTEAAEISYDNAAEFTVSNGRTEAVCKIAVPSGVDNSLFSGESLRKASVSQAVPRVIRRSDFIAFEITAEPDGEDELPLEMRITVPEGYNPDDCVLYYTPNRKTIVARMNSVVNEDGELEVTLYRTGTFLLAYEPDEEEEDSDGEEE